MAELVDALDLGSSILTDVGVRVPPLVPYKTIKILKDMELDFLTLSLHYIHIYLKIIFFKIIITLV